MPEVYTHELGDEISNQILELEGIETKAKKQSNILKAKVCPNCNEPNKPDSKFCSKCKMILTYDEYVETLEKQKHKQDKIEILENRVEEVTTTLQKFMELID